MASVDIKSPEILARAALEKTPMVGGLSNEQKLAKKLTDEASKKGPKAALEGLSTPSIPSEITKDSSFKEGFYSGFKANGEKEVAPGTSTEVRLNEAKKSEATIRTFLEKGWDYAGPGELTAAQRTEIKNSVKGMIDSWPDGKALLDANPGLVDPTINDILKNPRFKPVLQKMFSEALNPSAITEHLDPTLKAKMERAKAKRDTYENELKRNVRETTEANRILKEFRDTTKAGKGKDLTDLKAAEPMARNIIRIAPREIKTREEKISDLIQDIKLEKDPAKKTILEGQRNTLRDEVNDIRTQVDEAQEAIARKETLETEQANISKRKQELEEENEKLSDKLSDSEHEFVTSRVNYESSKNRHEQSEQEVVSKLQGAFNEATRAFLTQKVTELEQVRQEVIDKEAKEKEESKNKTTDDEKKLEKYLDNYWVRDISNRVFYKRWWNPNNKEIDRAGINTSYKEMLKNGPDSVLWQVLRGSDGVKFPDRAAATAWMKDPANSEVVGRMRSQLAEQILSRRIETGSITEGDARFIASTSWGKDSIQKAIDRRADIKKQIDGLKSQGVITGSTGEWVYEQVRKNPIFWLSLIFGSAAIGAIAPALYAGGIAGLAAAGPSAWGAAGAAGGMTAGLGGAKAKYSQ